MDTATVSSLIDGYFSNPPGGESDRAIRDFFLRTAESTLVLRNENTAVVCLDNDPRMRNDESSRDFYARFMREERRKYIERLKERLQNETLFDDDYNQNTNQSTPEFRGTENAAFFDKKSPWEQLCILAYREPILKVISENRIVIIKGFTGCGKSTQLPQYLADDCQSRGQRVNIVVTQPRRVAAKMLATRVASEMGCPLGTLVGYQIGLDQAKDLKQTKILYVTTGVLLQRVAMSPGCLRHLTHIILDEVHERSADMDMLFLLLKRKIFECSLDVKIILMSATCNVDLFQEYFTLPGFISASSTTCVDISPPVFEVRDPTGTSTTTIHRFKQEIFYLEDIFDKIQTLKSSTHLKYAESNVNYASYNEFLRTTSNSRMNFNKNYPQVHKALHEVVLAILFHQFEATRNRGTVLIFLPGLAEILELMEVLADSANSGRFNYKLSILHSTVSLQEQTEALKVSASGSTWHIILTTNIAESSLTVPNVHFVIDFCLVKAVLSCRQSYSMTYLALQWSSHSSADQRAGRTGRTNHGQVFRLLPRHFYDTALAHFEVPEFERTPLESYVLKAKLIDDRLPPPAVLAYALSPPALEDIEAALLTLKRMNALTINSIVATTTTTSPQDLVVKDGKIDVAQDEESYQRDNGHLTTLGYIMALLPMDVRLSKLVALGVVFDCTDEAVIIAAAHCTSGFFTQNRVDPLRSYRSHLHWTDRDSGPSDSLAYLRAYCTYQKVKATFGGVASRAAAWCARNELDYHRLLEMETLVADVVYRLASNLGINTRGDFLGGDGVRPPAHLSAYPQPEQELILKAIIAGAFYPNYFLRKRKKENCSSSDADLLRKCQSLSSVTDFTDTVVLGGLPMDTATSALYVPLLHSLFKGCSPNMEYRVEGDGMVSLKMDVKSPAVVAVDIDGFDKNGGGGGDGDLCLSPRSNNTTSSSVHASVYYALATRKLLKLPKLPETLNRFHPQIEAFHQKQLLYQVKNSFGSHDDVLKAENWSLLNIDTETSPLDFTVKVVQKPPKYTLPVTPVPVRSAPCIAVYLTSCNSPQMLFLLYKHSYVEKMLANIEMLARTLHLVEAGAALRLAQKNCGLEFKHSDDLVGNLVLAPLRLHQFKSLVDCGMTATSVEGLSQAEKEAKCIWARAEVVKVRAEKCYQTAFLFYIDFGLTDVLPVSCLHLLKCQSPLMVKEETCDALTRQQLATALNVQRIHDLLFSIAPLAVRCRLGRVQPPPNEAGCWTPQVKTYLSEMAARNRYAFKAKLYGQHLGADRCPLVELYSLYREAEEDEFEVEHLLDALCGAPAGEEEKESEKKPMSLSELLVATRLAEFRLDSLTANFSSDGITDFTGEEEVELVFDRQLQLNALPKITLSLDSLEIADEGQLFTQDSFDLLGPVSPLELTFSPLPQALNIGRSCTVAASSVNCVALENNSSTLSETSTAREHARLLVAGEVSLIGPRGDRLLLSHTSLMPDSLDFPVLMCMLWAPRVELRVNRLLSSDPCTEEVEELCGALCGLGYHPATGVSFDPDTDIELLFDSSLTAEDDVELVNLLRFYVSQFFYHQHQRITRRVGLQESLGLEKRLRRRQQLCRRTLLQLLTRSRFRRHWSQREMPTNGQRPASTTNQVRPTFRWNMFSQNQTGGGGAYRPFLFEFFNPALLESISLERAVLPPISIPILNAKPRWEIRVFFNLDNLEAGNWSACKDEASNRYTCKLCNLICITEDELQSHQHSAEHAEASRHFQRYYPVWQKELALARNFARSTYEQERAEEEKDQGLAQLKAKDLLELTYGQVDYPIGFQLEDDLLSTNTPSMSTASFDQTEEEEDDDYLDHLEDPLFLTPKMLTLSKADSAKVALLIDFSDDIPTNGETEESVCAEILC